MEKYNPIVSVITVCYNVVSCLKNTIDSVSSQTYSNVEYIIIDGKSSDGTVSIIEENKDKITTWVSECDEGIYDAMNKGIRMSHGEWLLFMNAGDVFVSNDILEKLVAEVTPDIRILRGDIIRIYNKIKVRSCGVTSQNPSLMDMFNNTFHHQASLIQKSLFSDYGLYSTEYKLCSDWIFFFNCVVLHNVKSRYLGMVVAEFQMDGASTNGALQYENERKKYLKQIYGDDLFYCLEELSMYRKSRISSLCLRVRRSIINRLSPKMFCFLLNVKRIGMSFLGCKVN